MVMPLLSPPRIMVFAFDVAAAQQEQRNHKHYDQQDPSHTILFQCSAETARFRPPTANHLLMSNPLRVNSWTPASLSVCKSEMPKAELRSVLFSSRFSLQPALFVAVLLPIVLNVRFHTLVWRSRSRNAAQESQNG